MSENILLDAFDLKPAEAIAFFRKKGYSFSWNWYDTWKSAHSQAFTVAKVMRADVLQDIRNMCDTALNEGITFQQFKKDLMPRLQAKGWWGKKEIVNKDTGLITDVQLGSVRRLRTIYQTNLQTSYMAGRYKQQTAVAQSRPYWQYVSVIDGKTTDRCRSLHLRIFRHDDPIWDTLYPPNHWGCRARVRTLSDRQIERGRLGVDSSEGKLVTKTATIGKGDNAREVSVTGLKLAGNNFTFWPDPGWDYNPGKTIFEPELKRYDRDIQKEIKKTPTPAVLPPTPVSTERSSQFVPDRFEKEIGKTLFPAQFWDKMGAKVPFRISKGLSSHYSYTYLPSDPGKIVLGGTRHKTKESKQFVAAHEYGHAFFRNHILKDSSLKKKFDAAYNLSKIEIGRMAPAIKAKFNNYFAHKSEMKLAFPDLPDDMLSELYLAVSDTMAAITHNQYGQGHSRKYFASVENRYHEFFAHASETYFVKNPIMKKLLPETAGAMGKFMEDVLK